MLGRVVVASACSVSCDVNCLSNDPHFSDDDVVLATPKKWNGSLPKPNHFHLTPSKNHAFQHQKAESIVQCSGAAEPNQENKNPNLPPLFFQNSTGGYRTSLDLYSEEGDRIPSTTPGAEPPRDVRDFGSARSHSTHLETSSSDRP